MENKEAIQNKLDSLKRRNERFDLVGTAVSVLATIVMIVGFAYMVYLDQDTLLVAGVFGLFLGMTGGMVLLRAVGWAQKHFVKEYFIQDCGNVIKLHGAVRLADMDTAYREILSVRPGYKIAEKAWDRFGCTLAAVPATNADRAAKSELESMGYQINSIA